MARATRQGKESFEMASTGLLVKRGKIKAQRWTLGEHTKGTPE